MTQPRLAANSRGVEEYIGDMLACLALMANTAGMRSLAADLAAVRDRYGLDELTNGATSILAGGDDARPL